MMYFGTGTFPLFLFLMPFILPLMIRVLSGAMMALSGAPTTGATQVSPSREEAFAAAKREFPNRLLELDNELTLAEEFDTDLNADELKAARSHLNSAFTTYSKSFGDADIATVNVAAARRTIEKHLAAAQRHMSLADPNSPLHNEAAAATAEKDAELSPEDELYRRFGVARGAYADAPFAPRVQPAARRTSVHLTPFGLMIGF